MNHAASIAALAACLACAGHPETAREATPALGISGSSAVRALDEEPPASPPPAACHMGKGDADATCVEGGSPELLPAVDAAIDELVLERPEIFNLERVVGSKGYMVLAPDAFYLGVAAMLQAKGLCAEWNYETFQVKSGQERSEQYDLLLSNDHIRRGQGSFRNVCTPAAFPLDAADVIHRVRVAFYSIQCDDGRTPPRNGEGLLPVDCTGYVTATPKKEDDSDVDRRIHGPEITWELEQAGEFVSIEDFPRVDFNKVLRGRDPGPFVLCATVETHKGCLRGEVITTTATE